MADPNDGMQTSPTGIDYLALIEAEQARATRTTINYFGLLPDDRDRTHDFGNDTGQVG